MRCVAILVLSALSGRSAWASFLKEHASLSTEMQPAIVAKTLARVEDEWRARATTFMECELAEKKEAVIRDCDDTPTDFSKSCSTVVGAVVQGSSGNPAVMREYMGNVCNQDIMGSNWHQSSCIALANTIGAKMSASHYDNRDNFQTSAVCDDFWTSFLAEQKTLHEKELVAINEQEKKALEAAAQEAKMAEEKSARAQKDLEEAEHGDNAKEEADLAAARKMVAKRTNRKVETVDRGLKEKEVEVEAVEAAAEKKIEEATKLEEEPLTPATKEAAAPLASEHAVEEPKPIVNTQVKKAQPLPRVATKDAPKPLSAVVAPNAMKPAVATMAANVANILAKAKVEKPVAAKVVKAKVEKPVAAKVVKPVAAKVVKAPVVAKEAKAPVVPVPEKKVLTALQQIEARGITDPCSGITCSASLKCPAGFAVTEVEGHCCPYCVNPNIKLEAAITGATGSNGGKASTFCPKVWCFPTACTKALSNPTTTNGACCATCPA